MTTDPFDPVIDFRIKPGWCETGTIPALFPREGVAAALVVERNGHEHVEPVIVVDFYREAVPT
jgi:hypothetical protein